MKRVLALIAISLSMSGCCLKLDVPFVPFIADPRIGDATMPASAAAPSVTALTSDSATR